MSNKNAIKDLIAETAKHCIWASPEFVARTVHYVTTVVPPDSGKGVKLEDALEHVGPWFSMPVGIPHPDESKDDELYYVAGAKSALATLELLFTHIPGLTSRQTLGGYGWSANKESWAANSLRAGGPRTRVRSVAELRKIRFAYDVICSIIPTPADWNNDPKSKKIVPIDQAGNIVNEYVQLRTISKTMFERSMETEYKLTDKNGNLLTKPDVDLATSEGENAVKGWIEAGLLGPLATGSARAKGFRWLSPVEQRVAEEERAKKGLAAFTLPPTLAELDVMTQEATEKNSSRRGRLSSTDREELEREAMERSRELLGQYQAQERALQKEEAEPPTREDGGKKKKEKDAPKHQHA